MKKPLNLALFISFIVTILAPLTGVHIHKMASVTFLLLSMVHAIVYRRKLSVKRWLLMVLVAVSFLTGLFGMIPDQYPLLLTMHRGISIVIVFFLAIHIFVYHRRLIHFRK